MKSAKTIPTRRSVLVEELVDETYRIFPFPTFKNDQGTLINKVLTCDRLIIQASTGFGKTAVMLSALLPFVRKINTRLVIVTRTKMQIFSVFMRELRKLVENINDDQLQEAYRKFTIVPLIGKSTMCTNSSVAKGQSAVICTPCKRYQKTKKLTQEEFQHITDVLDWLADFKSLSSYRNELHQHGCPYYVAWKMVYNADIILTSHAYLRNPDLLSLLFQVIDKSNEYRPRPTFLLVDEAHDFGPVVLAELTRGELDFLASEFPYELLTALRETVITKTGLIDTADISSLDLEVLRSAIGAFQQNARKTSDKHEREKQLKNARMTTRFLDFIQANGDYWAVIPPPELDTGLTKQRNIVMKMDPEEIMELEKKRRIVILQPFPDKVFDSLGGLSKVMLMSGTFKPLDLYSKYYGLKDYQKYSARGKSWSRFEAVLINRSYCSSFKDRNTQLYQRYAMAIKQLHEINPNHTVVFTPSYAFKDGIMQFIGTRYEEKTKLGGFDWLDDLAFLDHELVIATSGGKLVEGIEILQGGSGRSLITMVIYAGLPYPPPDFLSREVLTKLYTKKWNKENAKQFLTDLPLLRNIQQGFGRGIRNPDDFSAAIILDWRGQYINVFDRYMKTPDLNRLISKLEEFYS
ncbi:MAG: helicase C-terminal domain-containing protein, partial [Candidatus Hodarchaeales archaeon]